MLALENCLPVTLRLAAFFSVMTQEFHNGEIHKEMLNATHSLRPRLFHDQFCRADRAVGQIGISQGDLSKLFFAFLELVVDVRRNNPALDEREHQQ
jgi:hypothetical protein